MSNITRKEVRQMAEAGWSHRKMADYCHIKTVREFRGQYGDILWDIEKKRLDDYKDVRDHILHMAKTCRNNPVWSLYADKAWAGHSDTPPPEPEVQEVQQQTARVEIVTIPGQKPPTAVETKEDEDTTH